MEVRVLGPIEVNNGTDLPLGGRTPRRLFAMLSLLQSNYGENLQLITGTETSALVWNLDVEQWPAIVCTAAGSNLTPAEWDQWGPTDDDHHAICEQFPLPA